jgi:hypothetical protein
MKSKTILAPFYAVPLTAPFYCLFVEYTGLLGVQRKLGMRESTYWIANWLTVLGFVMISSTFSLFARFTFTPGFPFLAMPPFVMWLM